jgi:hypothetical protein
MAVKRQQEERSFKYKKRTKEELKERANMKGGNFDTYIKPKFKQWKPKEGKNIIRILPATWDNARHYGLDIFINFNIGADNQSYLSLSKHEKGDDPLAEARREAQKDGDKKLAKALQPSQRLLYWIIDRMDEDEGPILWAAPFTFDKALANLCIDEDTGEIVSIDDPEEGCDIRFYREGTGLNTNYDASKMKILKPSPIHEDEGLQTEWLDFIVENDLPSVLNFYDYDHIKATFDGQAGRDEDDEVNEKSSRNRRKPADDEDEKPVQRTRAKPADDEDEKPVRRRAARDDDNDEDEKPARRRSVAADDDEDEKPAVRSRSRLKSDGDEEDEKPKSRHAERDADDDEDDDGPPQKSRRGKTEDDEETGGSLRERIARRRSRSSDDD